MVKFVMYCVKALAAAIIGLLVTSCNGNFNVGKSITGSGNVVKEQRNLNTFDKVTVCCGLECEIVQAADYKVTVEADDNLIRDIKTTVENGTLVIATDYTNYKNVSSKKIIVQMPIVKKLETTSGSSLTSSNLHGSNVRIKTSSGSKMEITVESDTISLESSSGSHQRIKGKALILKTKSSSGSTIDAKDLMANEVSSESSSGSSTKTHPLLHLKASASSGSSISYVNQPKTISKEESSGGRISKK
jgi:hypothetical protein